ACQWIRNSQENNLDLKKEFINPLEAENRLEQLLKANKLDQHVSMETIKKWCTNENDSNKIFEIMSLLYGLAESQLTPASTEVFIKAVQDFWNSLPKKSLGNKSPQDKFNEKPGYVPE